MGGDTFEVPIIPSDDAILPYGSHALPIDGRWFKRVQKSERAIVLVGGRAVGTLVRVVGRERSRRREEPDWLAVQTVGRAQVIEVLQGGRAVVRPEAQSGCSYDDEHLMASLKLEVAALRQFLGPYHRKELTRLLEGASPAGLDELACWLCGRAYEYADDDDDEPIDLVRQQFLEIPTVTKRIGFLTGLLPRVALELRRTHEAATKSDWQVPADAFYAADAQHYIHVAEHQLWERELPECEHGVLPCEAVRTNPVLWNDLLIVSCFSPGMVWAVESATGEPRWSCPLESLGGKPPWLTDELLLVQDSNTLFALNPEDGRMVWSFCPLGTRREGMYSPAVESRGSVFIGDRRGFLHCLSTKTGDLFWSTPTSPEERDLNSAPFLHDDLVLAANNDGRLCAYTQDDGCPLWSVPLDDSFGGQALGLFEGAIVVNTRRSVSLVRPLDGTLVYKLTDSEGLSAGQHCVAGDLLLVRWSDETGEEEHPAYLAAYRQGAEVYRVEAARMVEKLVWDPVSRLVFELRIDGMGLLDPLSGVRVAGFLPRSSLAQISHPAREGDRYYFWSSDGVVRALQGPVRSWLPA